MKNINTGTLITQYRIEIIVFFDKDDRYIQNNTANDVYDIV